MDSTQFACYGINKDSETVIAYGRIGPFDGLSSCVMVSAQLFVNGAVTVITNEWDTFVEWNPEYQ